MYRHLWFSLTVDTVRIISVCIITLRASEAAKQTIVFTLVRLCVACPRVGQ